MQTLPTLVSTANLNAILATIANLPGAEINRSDSAVTVHATRKTQERVKVLSAVLIIDNEWHVIAEAGMLIPNAN
jgi:trehalose-6-phosphatase